jgi:hypothetical protein
MKSTKGKVAGGYLHIQWEDVDDSRFGSDSQAFLINIDNQIKLTPTKIDRAVRFYRYYGPCFGEGSLCICGDAMMNGPDNCSSCTNGRGGDDYNVPSDAEGNSILTGDGQGKRDYLKSFTLAALETWAVTY